MANSISTNSIFTNSISTEVFQNYDEFLAICTDRRTHYDPNLGIWELAGALYSLPPGGEEWPYPEDRGVPGGLVWSQGEPKKPHSTLASVIQFLHPR